jgi:Ribbon-helix-helix protein, copG family
VQAHSEQTTATLGTPASLLALLVDLLHLLCKFCNMLRRVQMDRTTQEHRNDTRVLVGAHVDPAQRERLVQLAAREETSVATIVRRALRSELDRADHGQAASS